MLLHYHKLGQYTIMRNILHKNATNNRKRGFSVVELVVVLAVMAVLIPLAIRFTSETVDITDTQAQRAALYRTTEDAVYQIEKDLTTARSCETSLLDPPVISISGTILEFIADIDGDGDGDYVKYEITTDGTLTRTTSTEPNNASEPCVFGNTVVVEEIATFPSGSSGRFMANHPDETAPVTARICRGLTSNFDSCDFVSISVEIEQQSLVPDTPNLTITKEIAINQRWGRS